MKSYILLFVTLTQATSFGQNQPPEAAPERIQGYDLVERYAEQISQRAASPERQAVRKQIEDEFQLRLKQFYADHPLPITESPVLRSSPKNQIDPATDESTVGSTSGADDLIDSSKTVTALKPELPFDSQDRSPEQPSEGKLKFTDSNLKKASLKSGPSAVAESDDSVILLLPDLVSALDRLERQLQKLEDRLKRLERVQ